MAIAIAHELSNGSNTDAATYTTASVSVTAGETLWLIVSNGSTAGTADLVSAITGTLGTTLSFASEVTALMNSSLRGRLTILKAACPSTASGTITFNFGGVVQANCQWIIVTTTGNSLTVRQVKTGQMSGTNPSITLDSTPLTSSMVLAALLMNTNTTPTAGTGKTIIGSTFVGASPSVVQAAEYDIGSATAATAFVSPSTANKCMVAIEVVEDAPSEGTFAGAINWVGRFGRDLIDELTFPVIANHRGGAGEWPEDTYYALQQSWADFPGNIGEYDLQQNASGSLVPMHDTTMDRTTTSTGNVSAVNDAAWASVVVDIGPGGNVNPGFYVDIRDDFRGHIHMPEIQTTAAANLLVSYLQADPGLYWNTITQAFSKTYTTIMADGGFRVCQVYSSGATIDLADDVARGMWGVLLDQNDSDLDAGFVTTAHGLGLVVGAYTVNTVGARDTLLAMGVDIILTNEPTDLALTQEHNLVVADLAHGHTVETVALTQQHTLTAADTAHGHTVEGVALTQVHGLTAVDTAHSHAVEGVTLTQVHNLQVNDLAHAHAVEGVTLTQAHSLTAQDAVHGHAVESVALTQDHTLAVADTAHVHAVEPVTLTQVHHLVVDDLAHGHTVESTTLTQVHNLAVDDAVHAHTIESVSLGQAGELAVEDARHGHTIESVALTQVHELVVDDLVHGHTVESVDLGGGQSLTVADVAHGHTVESVTLTQGHNLVVDDVVHGHTVDAVAVTQGHNLAVDDLTHGHTIEAADVTVAVDLVVDDLTHGHTTDTVALTQAHNLTVNDVRHTHTVDAVALAQTHALQVLGMIHTHTVDTVILTVGDLSPPPERIAVVPAEDRLAIVTPESRTLTVLGETRTETNSI